MGILDRPRKKEGIPSATRSGDRNVTPYNADRMYAVRFGEVTERPKVRHWKRHTSPENTRKTPLFVNRTAFPGNFWFTKSFTRPKVAGGEQWPHLPGRKNLRCIVWK